MPELSFGTHFFQDLVESDIFYIAIFPDKAEVLFNRDWFLQMPNAVTRLSPQGAKYATVVKVYESVEERLHIMSDIMSQKVVCFSK